MTASRRLALAPLALVAGLALVPVASASQPQPCADQTYDTHFRAFKDDGWYALIDNGDFDSGTAGWDLQGAASLVRDDDGGVAADDQTGAGGDLALQLGPGGSVVSPPVCVTNAHKAMRFYAYSGRLGHRGGKVKVEMLYTDAKKDETRVWKVGEADGSGDAATPTKKFTLDVKRYGLHKDDAAETTVRFRISAADPDQTMRIDDVDIDPRLR